MKRMAALSGALLLAMVLAFPAGIAARGKPDTEATNNLSVPTILVGGGGFTGVTCGGASSPSALLFPSGDPRADYEAPGSWYVQTVHKWQAQCYVDGTASAAAEWGDNLAGDAKLRVGKPIRVELGLEATNPDALRGFTVVKLEPSKLDRESAYGTLAEMVGEDWVAVADDFAAMRVFDGAATFSIKHVATDTYVVPEGTPAKGENQRGRQGPVRVSAQGDGQGRVPHHVHPSERHHHRHGRRRLRRAPGMAEHHGHLRSGRLNDAPPAE